MIVSLGEALIDLIHAADGTQKALVGGSPYNVSIALSRLGVDAGFVCPFSQDDHGQMLTQGLADNGVQRCIEDLVTAPTAVAEVFTDDSGHPRYVFHREGTADRALRARPPIDGLPASLKALHFGSLVLAQENDWPAWKAAIVQARTQGAFIAFDPNIRVKLIDDLDRYRTRLAEAIELADLIKASDEDMELLKPGCVPEEDIQGWASPTRTVVLTEGKKGAQIWTPAGHHIAHRETAKGPIVDTVGAGDTFQAALLAWHWHRDAFGARLTPEDAQSLLAFATKAAGLNCMQAGCQPPRLAEVNAS